MALAGPSAPTSASQTPVTGTVAWGTPSNIETSGASYATLLVNATSIASENLMGEGFGFSIPSGATINGIVVSIAIVNTPLSSYCGLDSVQLLKAGAVAGTAKTGTFTSTQSFGSSSDLWGTTWTPAQINAAGFGVAVTGGGTNYYGSVTVQTNAWLVTVYYTPAGSGAIASVSGLFGF